MDEQTDDERRVHQTLETKTCACAEELLFRPEHSGRRALVSIFFRYAAAAATATAAAVAHVAAAAFHCRRRRRRHCRRRLRCQV